MGLPIAIPIIDTAINFAGRIIDRIWPTPPTPEQRAALIGQIAPLIDDRDDVVVNAQREIIVAEMQQGDAYTKRARPSVVYFGLLFIGLVHVLFPMVAKIIVITALWRDRGNAVLDAAATRVLELTAITLPSEFWWAWGSVVSIWSIGRSAERRGMANKLIEMVTGGGGR
jgi:hypothetical protein